MFRSSDGGDTWIDLQPPTRASGTAVIVVAPSNGTVLYRTTSDFSAYPERSDDRGVTWRPVARLPGFRGPSALAVDPRDENSVWAAAFNAYFPLEAVLYHSTDGGAHWQVFDGPFGSPFPAAMMRFDPNGGVLHVAYPGHGIWELTQ